MCVSSRSIITTISAVYKYTITVNNQITIIKALSVSKLGNQAYNCQTLEVRIINRIINNLRNKCKGHGLINRPPMSPYLHNCWWRNKPPTTIQEAKPKKEDIPSEAEASPPPQSLTNYY